MSNAGSPVALARATRSIDARRATAVIKPTATLKGHVWVKKPAKSPIKSDMHRLGMCEGNWRTRKRSASGTSHLAVANSLCAHLLQERFSAQPRVIASLAKKIRNRCQDC